MPPRPPPSPPILTILCSIAALVGVWLSLAVDQLARAAALALLGVSVGPVAADERFFVVVLHGPLGGLGPWSFAFVVLTGTLAVVGLAFAFSWVTSALRSAGWVRGLALGWFTVALLWVPAALVAAGARTGAGPAAEVYRRLGAPRAGRWSAVVLGLVVLVLVAGPVSNRAIAIGRAWMRADGLGFRRRLVRVTAGWPAVAGCLALGLIAGWVNTAWLGVIPVAVLAALHWRTR